MRIAARVVVDDVAGQQDRGRRADFLARMVEHRLERAARDHAAHRACGAAEQVRVGDLQQANRAFHGVNFTGIAGASG